jgi:hypothetical protein
LIAEKDYKILGKLLVKKNPALADEYLSLYKTHSPKEIDNTKISFYFYSFCEVMEITPETYLGPLHKSSKVDIRRLFVACMVHLYQPHVFYQPIDEINLSKKGFVMHLSRTLQQQESNISTMIREVIAWEKDYDDFKEKVHGIIELLTKEAA